MTIFELARTVRFCLPAGAPSRPTRQPRSNTFAGWPSMEGLGVFVELIVRCRRSADPRSGFVMSIAEIDDAVRSDAMPIVANAIPVGDQIDPANVLLEIVAALQQTLGESVSSVTWNLTPHYQLSMEPSDMTRVRMSQQFEFAASHRLHNPALADEENDRLYGKCNNPNGHGHNYRIQVMVSRPLSGDDGPSFTLQDLERIVSEHVVSRFDHTHLNLDTVEFAELIPTVEHIVKVCFDLAAGPIADAGARLEEITVWETDKTSCTYRGPAGRPVNGVLT